MRSGLYFWFCRSSRAEPAHTPRSLWGMGGWKSCWGRQILQLCLLKPKSASSNPNLTPQTPGSVFFTLSNSHQTHTKRISWLLGSQAVKLHCLANELMGGSKREAKKERQEKAPCPSELGWSWAGFGSARWEGAAGSER